MNEQISTSMSNQNKRNKIQDYYRTMQLYSNQLVKEYIEMYPRRSVYPLSYKKLLELAKLRKIEVNFSRRFVF